MIYKKVKKINTALSAIGFGCWGASGPGSWPGHTDQDQIKAIHTAIDRGINFFDVAPVYGLGYAESVLGQALKGKRDQVFLATKCGLPWDDALNVRNDVTGASILKEVDDSLKRLGVDHIDLYQVHWPTANGVPIEETMTALKVIQTAGKVKYVGLTNFSVDDAKRANQIVDISSMQGLYNMIEHNASSYHGIGLDYRVKDDVLAFTQEEGMAFVPYSPLFQGLLSGNFSASTRFLSGDVRNSNPKLNGDAYLNHLNLVSKLKKLADEAGKPLNEVALNWLICQDAVTSIIAGVKDASQVEANLKALDWTMDQDMYHAINALVDASGLYGG